MGRIIVTTQTSLQESDDDSGLLYKDQSSSGIFASADVVDITHCFFLFALIAASYLIVLWIRLRCICIVIYIIIITYVIL